MPVFSDVSKVSVLLIIATDSKIAVVVDYGYHQNSRESE
jgi:hypothetical protein